MLIVLVSKRNDALGARLSGVMDELLATRAAAGVLGLDSPPASPPT